jgi:uncharacterized protein
MGAERLTRDAVLRVGEVSAVEGRRIFVLVDRNKNLSDVFFDGDVVRNISVGGYIEIRKGFLSIIGRVEGERIQEDVQQDRDPQNPANRSRRTLTVSLAGFFDESGGFVSGTKELPLIGNEAYIVTREKLHRAHNLVRPGMLSINIATTYTDDVALSLPVDGLFNTHIAIFGNTGSGKTNTLAALYQALLRALRARNAAAFTASTRYVLLDFNGEYSGTHCITEQKTVYSLSTRIDGAAKLPMPKDALLDVEVLSILADATEKTQRPFLRRMLRFLKLVQDADDPEGFIKNILRKRARDWLQMSDKIRAFLILDYFKQILPSEDADGNPIELDGDLDWHNVSQGFRLRAEPNVFLSQNPHRVPDTTLHHHIENLEFGENLLRKVLVFLYAQLITDVLANRAVNEHVMPVINRLRGKEDDIDRLFEFSDDAEFWTNNFVVVNLHDVNLDMKKTIPLLLVKRLYSEHKLDHVGKTLTIIVDEAHNILSTESFRESESWKDYRLETFEEIIKEGRKFGVFVTIASQRPNDISPTITSQAHNYFIHRLINDRDLNAIASAVSYIDRMTEESIPSLPTGTCIFSGIATTMPLKIAINPLDANSKPQSATREFAEVLPPQHG